MQNVFCDFGGVLCCVWFTEAWRLVALDLAQCLARHFSFAPTEPEKRDNWFGTRMWCVCVPVFFFLLVSLCFVGGNYVNMWNLFIKYNSTIFWIYFAFKHKAKTSSIRLPATNSIHQMCSTSDTSKALKYHLHVRDPRLIDRVMTDKSNNCSVRHSRQPNLKVHVIEMVTRINSHIQQSISCSPTINAPNRRTLYKE